MKRILAGLIVAVVMTGAAVAGPWEDGNAAYTSGDYATALKLLQPLAEQGDVRAQNTLGHMYKMGNGVPQVDALAVKWYRLSAEQNYAYAQTSLGRMYEFGFGVPQDDVQAHMWLSLAIAQGDGLGAADLDLVTARMKPDQLAEAERQMREWKPAPKP